MGLGLPGKVRESRRRSRLPQALTVRPDHDRRNCRLVNSLFRWLVAAFGTSASSSPTRKRVLDESQETRSRGKRRVVAIWYKISFVLLIDTSLPWGYEPSGSILRTTECITKYWVYNQILVL